MSSSLPTLAEVTRLGPRIVRILGCNPGQYTLQGTNTYLIGAPESPLCLFDVGQGIPQYLEHLERALKETSKSPQVQDIILSHWHKDHVHGIIDVLRLLQKLGSPRPRVWKWPCEQHDDEVIALLGDASDAYTPSDKGQSLHELTEQTVVESLSQMTARFLHVPGHTSDSIALHLSDDKVLLTADTVLGHGTAVFEDLKDYIASLEKLEQAGQTCESLLPGHGDVTAPAVIRMYIEHRMQRERQVVEQLSKASSAGLTAEDIMLAIYDGQIAEGLKPAATHSVGHHLEKLRKERKVKAIADSNNVDRWVLTGTESVASANI